jgi:hypothetical protein
MWVRGRRVEKPSRVAAAGLRATSAQSPPAQAVGITTALLSFGIRIQRHVGLSPHGALMVADPATC